ncbi:hypothetical protein [Symmachiella dynata]|uniref:hypothetical protein n=1 Tax=Symmachiella dynata TaxID=2527995 RepID=UPI0030EB2B3F
MTSDMRRKTNQKQQLNLRALEAHHEQLCRDLITKMCAMPKPLSYETIHKSEIENEGEPKFGGAAHFVEAEALLNGALSACIDMGWLRVKRERPHTFIPTDLFDLPPQAYRVKRKSAKSKPTVKRHVTITVHVKDYGLDVSNGGETIVLKGNNEVMLTMLYHKSNKTLSTSDSKKKNAGSLAHSIYILRKSLEKLGLDELAIKNGIVADRGQGYRLDTNVLRVLWKDELGRQRRVVSYNQS